MTQDRAAEIAEIIKRLEAWKPYARVGTLIDDTIAALTAAREEGRREGWETACRYIAVDRGQIGLAERMRALADKEPKP